MRRLCADTALPMLAGACGVMAIVLPGGSAPRGLAGILLVSVLPGTAFARALLPGRGHAPERALVGLGISVAVVALAAVALYGLGLPLEPAVWVPVLLLVTAAGSVVSMFRRRPATMRRPRGRWWEALLLVLAAAVVFATVWLGTTPLPPPSRTPGYTAVWMAARSNGRAVVVATSAEMTATSYRLEVRAPGRVLDVSPTFTLRPGQRYREVIRLRDAGPRWATALLYRVERGTPRLYRKTQLARGAEAPSAAAIAAP